MKGNGGRDVAGALFPYTMVKDESVIRGATSIYPSKLIIYGNASNDFARNDNSKLNTTNADLAGGGQPNVSKTVMAGMVNGAELTNSPSYTELSEKGWLATKFTHGVRWQSYRR